MPHPKVKISDNSGNEVAVTSNALDVNIAGGATIDIGDVDMFLDSGDALIGGAGVTTDGTLRVTLATNDVITNAHLAVTGAVASAIAGLSHDEDDGHSTGDAGIMTLAVRNDTLAALAGTDGDYAPLQVNEDGALYVDFDDTGSHLQGLLSTLNTTITGVKTAVELIDDAISGSEMQVDVVASLPAGTNIIGKVGHDITGGADGVTVVSSAGSHVVLGGDVDCKKIDIQAQTDNTGLIAVGFTGVDATEATGTGVILYAGDTYSLEMVNLNIIYIDSTVSGEGVRYTYFT